MLFLVRVCAACGTANVATCAFCARCSCNIQSIPLESLAVLAEARHQPGLHPALPARSDGA
jgi:hypothetical protein